MPPGADTSVSAVETPEERPCGVTAVVLADVHCLEVYEFFDRIMRRLGRETGTLINLRKPGHPGKNDDRYKAHRSPELERRDLAAVPIYEGRIRSVGDDEQPVLASLSEEIGELIGAERRDLPALGFQLLRPPMLGGGYEWFLVRVPLALLLGVSARRDLEDVLCRWLQAESVCRECPNLAMPESVDDVKRIKDYLRRFEQAMAALAGRHVKRFNHALAIELPGERTAPPSLFPTPSGTTWSQVTIRFKDDETIVVQVKGRAEREVNFIEMGMGDRRAGRQPPTRQWELLRGFAVERGELDWSSVLADPKLQKRREKLAKNLKAYFQIDEDPFEWLPRRKAWRSKFLVSPSPEPE